MDGVVYCDPRFVAVVEKLNRRITLLEAEVVRLSDDALNARQGVSLLWDLRERDKAVLPPRRGVRLTGYEGEPVGYRVIWREGDEWELAR